MKAKIYALRSQKMELDKRVLKNEIHDGFYERGAESDGIRI